MTKVAQKEISLEPEGLPQIAISSSDPLKYEGSMLAMAIYDEELEIEDKKVSIKGDKLKSLNEALGGLVEEILENGDFKGKLGNNAFLRIGGRFRYFGLLGLGSQEKANGELARKVFMGVGEALAQATKDNKCVSCGFHVLGGIDEEASSTVCEAITRGLILGGYESTRFKAEGKKSKLQKLELVQLVSENKQEDALAIIKRTETMARGAFLTRHLVETPANICTPSYLANTAKQIAESAPEVMKLQVFEKEECEKMGMGCYLSVSEASAEPPKFIHLTYTPKSGEIKKKIAIVGKGVTFDSGGYNIKLQLIELMKFDMGGAGAVMGSAKIIAEMQPEDVEVHFVVAACENMISAQGMRPGDVLTASNGKTVEVLNTDAEGRLTLADALIYVQEKCGVEKILDMATLTGAQIVALGPKWAALYTESESLLEEIQKASDSCGDRVWRMPLEEAYDEYNKSKIADVSNLPSSRFGSSISAALFLKRFIEADKVEWAHIDMAGPVWNYDKGFATGYGAQLFAEWAILQGQ